MGREIRVLHVGPNSTLAEVIGTELSQHDDGITVQEAASVEDALRSVSGVDCVVSAYELPEMDGLELLGEIRERRPEVPFILCAEEGSERLASDAISAGVTDYFALDHVTEEPEQLAACVRNAVEVTQQRKRLERLKEQRDNLEVLNQMVRHDIRNDLQLVLTYLGLLEDFVEGDGVDYLETVTGGINNAITMTEKARELSEAILYAETSEEIDIDLVIEDQIESIESNYDDAAVTVDGSLPDVSVLANDLIDSVIYNILQNAIEHNDKDTPEVTVSVSPTDEAVVVEIADNGPGIDDDEEVFTRGEKGHDSEGTGIGLYLVETVLDQYEGDVWVEDNDPEGAVFGLEFPRPSA